jgi:7tm Odorant receptor
MDAELFKPFKFCFLVLKVTGIWQDGNQSWTYFFVGYFTQFFIIYLHIAGHLHYAFNADNLSDFVDAFGYFITVLTIVTKVINFIYKLDRIKSSLKNLTSLLDLSADKRWKSRNHLRIQVAFALKVLKMFWFSAFTACSFAIFVPFQTHTLPFKVSFPFNTKNNEIGFLVAAFYVTFGSFYVSLVDIILVTLPTIFMAFGIGLINELVERLNQIGTSAIRRTENAVTAATEERICRKSDEKVVSEFIKCIEIQTRIKQFIHEIQSNFSLSIFIQGLLSSVILCTSAFTASTVRNY